MARLSARLRALTLISLLFVLVNGSLLLYVVLLRASMRKAREDATAAPAVVRVEFRLESVVIDPETKGIIGFFRFANVGEASVSIPGFGPPKNGMFRPRFVGYEFDTAAGWQDLGIMYCGLGYEEYTIDANTNLVLWIHGLELYESRKAPADAKLRVSVGQFTSEPFDLAQVRASTPK